MIVYCITNSVNGKLYIGINTRRNLARARWNEHRRAANSKLSGCYERPLYRAIRKYGPDSFSFRIIDSAESFDQLAAKEVQWIAHYDTTNPKRGYNRTPGGTFSYFTLLSAADQEAERERLRSIRRDYLASLDPARKAFLEAARIAKLTSPAHRAMMSAIKRHEWAAITGDSRRRRTAHLRAYAERADPVAIHTQRLAASRKANEARVKSYEALSRDGQRMFFRNLNAFCRQQGLDVRPMSRLARGHFTHYLGWKCWELDADGKRISQVSETDKGRRMFWLIRHDDGIVREERDLKAFCAKNDLNYKQLWKVASGRARQHRGWSILEGILERVISVQEGAGFHGPALR